VPLGCDGEIYETKNIITHINFFSDASLGCLLKSNSLKLLKVKSGPLISKKRYLPVITAIAQKNTSNLESLECDGSYELTKQQMKQKINMQVYLKNVLLVATHPMQYARAVMKKAVG